MRLYLCTWEEGHGESRNPQSRFVSGTDQWKMLMKLHLAERDPQHHAWPKRGADKGGLRLRILLSYWYYKDVDLDALFAKYFTPPYPEVFADSGAFSAMTQGVPITVQGYANWLKRWQHLFSAYANLDVIHNAEKTWENQRQLEDMGLNVLPVFHAREGWDWLEKYVDQYSYMALGGVVGGEKKPAATIRWLVKCFRIGGEKAVFHGFGLTSWQIMKSFPWYSVDSSSWGSGFRYGQVPLFDENKGCFFEARLGNAKSCYKLTPLFRALGFDPADFADRRRNERAKICAISALSYMKAERWLRGYWGEVHIPGRADAPAGLRAHLVTGADSPDAPKGGNMSLGALSQAGLGGTVQGAQGAGERLHLADTSNGINFGDADAGLKIYGAAGNIEGGERPLANMSVASLDLVCAAEEMGMKLHLADARPHSSGDLAAAEAGLRQYLGATAPGQQAEWRAWHAIQDEQDNGPKIHLGDSYFEPGHDLGRAQAGLRVYLAEHSLDRGGLGDTSRAMEVLDGRP